MRSLRMCSTGRIGSLGSSRPSARTWQRRCGAWRGRCRSMLLTTRCRSRAGPARGASRGEFGGIRASGRRHRWGPSPRRSRSSRTRPMVAGKGARSRGVNAVGIVRSVTGRGAARRSGASSRRPWQNAGSGTTPVVQTASLQYASTISRARASRRAASAAPVREGGTRKRSLDERQRLTWHPGGRGRRPDTIGTVRRDSCRHARSLGPIAGPGAGEAAGNGGDDVRGLLPVAVCSVSCGSQCRQLRAGGQAADGPHP